MPKLGVSAKGPRAPGTGGWVSGQIFKVQYVCMNLQCAGHQP